MAHIFRFSSRVHQSGNNLKLMCRSLLIMGQISMLSILPVLLSQIPPVYAQTTVFINEIHYDNTGTDENEAVEIAGPAGTDITGWRLVRYNGSDGSVYTSPAANPPGSDVLTGSIPDLGGGFGVVIVYYQTNGLQNGSPDGIALVDDSDNVIQFLTYEGSFTATDGPASGMTGTDIGVSESSSGEVGYSLQLGGTGSEYEDFSWQNPLTATFGSVNTGQTFIGGGDNAPYVSSTSPSDGAMDVAVDVDLEINFSEDVTVSGNWFSIIGATTGSHTAVATGGPKNFVLNPDADFANGETITVTIFALSVTDNDLEDPPDNMVNDHIFSFTSVPEMGDWVINEIHADPDANNGDANNDGTVNTSEDEFVEIINISGGTVDISGWTLSDGVGVRHSFPTGTAIPDHCAVLVFAGGTPTGSFGDVTVQTASTGQLGLNNTGDTITLNNGTFAVATYTYGSEGGDNQSLTRDPDITGADPLVKHTLATGSGGALYSPGTKVDGSKFSGCEPGIPKLEIFEIQGLGLTSAYAGQTVSTENNVVTAIGPDGFFIQTPSARADGNPETSDGIFVYTASTPALSLGDHVDVTGAVEEYYDLTEFTNSPTITIVSSGNPLPANVLFNDDTPSPDQPQPDTELERYEGMLIELQAGITTAPTDIHGVTAIVAKALRTFREPGIEYPGEPNLPIWDGNPEIFAIDPDRLGLANAEMFAGTKFTTTGVLGYSFGEYQIWPTLFNITGTPTIPDAVRSRATGEVTIGSLNMLQLFQDEPDPAAYQDRLTKFSMYIRELLQSPEILAVQEVENIGTLQDLANKIKNDDASLDYTPYLLEGNDASGIDIGYLVLSTVQVNSVTQLGAAEIFTYDGTLLHDRPPLLLAGEFAGGKPITVLNLHLRSMVGIDDPDDGPRVRQKRHEQATSVSLMVQNLQTTDPNVNLIVCGDFNAFEFTDGYVDVLGQIMGTPSDATQAMIPGTDEVEPDLTNQVLAIGSGDRYSYNSGNNAQVLDHILTSQAVANMVTGLEYARANSDAPESYKSNATTPVRSSDHDGIVLYLSLQERYDINGTVTYDSNDRPVPGTQVNLSHGEGTSSYTTGENGEYAFQNVIAGAVNLVPSKEGDLRDAITGSDALFVLQYLAFLADMTDDEKFAADVTEDGDVTGSDAQAILRYLAFFTDWIGSTGQWRFLPPNSSFTLATNTVVDFKAYLLGDANLNWGATGSEPGLAKAIADADIISKASLSLDKIDGYQLENLEIPLEVVTGGEMLYTLVMSLSYDPDYLTYQATLQTSLSEGFTVIANGNEPDKIHIAMAGINGIATDGAILRFIFKVTNPAICEDNTRLEITRAFINDFQVSQVTNGSISFIESDINAIPDHFALMQNYPNPFNPETRISYQLPGARHVNLTIFNLMGEVIKTLATEKKEAGYHQIIWDGTNNIGESVPSGMYLISIKAGEWRMSRKMLKIQ